MGYNVEVTVIVEVTRRSINSGEPGPSRARMSETVERVAAGPSMAYTTPLARAAADDAAAAVLAMLEAAHGSADPQR